MKDEFTSAFEAYQRLVELHGMQADNSLFLDAYGDWFHAPEGFGPVRIGEFTAMQLMAHQALNWWRKEHGNEAPGDKWALKDPCKVLHDVLQKVVHERPTRRLGVLRSRRHSLLAMSPEDWRIA